MGYEWDFWNVTSMANGVLSTGTAGKLPINGTGNPTSPLSCSDAACVGLTAGMVRQPELASGAINHALFRGALHEHGQRLPDDPYNYGTTCAGSSIPTGQWFQLSASAPEIAALAVSNWQKTILTAMRRYRMFVGDEGSNGAFELEVESPATWVGATNPWSAYAAQAQVQTNSNITSQNTSAGVTGTRSTWAPASANRGGLPPARDRPLLDPAHVLKPITT